jgi:hypothetical protein
MWVSGSADWPAAERQLIISRLGANRRPIRWAAWQMPSLGNWSGKSFAGIQSATYRPGTYVSGRLRWASARRWPAARRWEALACFQAKPVAGWLPGGWQHQPLIMPPSSSTTAGLLREMCSIAVLSSEDANWGASPAALGAG